MTPLPKVSAKKYPESRPAQVRFRIKGNTDGPIYRGQELMRPCKTCPGGK